MKHYWSLGNRGVSHSDLYQGITRPQALEEMMKRKRKYKKFNSNPMLHSKLWCVGLKVEEIHIGHNPGISLGISQANSRKSKKLTNQICENTRNSRNFLHQSGIGDADNTQGCRGLTMPFVGWPIHING